MTDEPFDAKRARANRPFPLWVDAISRKTALLSTDEFGAYIKLLMAMWSSREAALPNDPKKLARAAGVSVRLWNSRIGPALSGFWIECPEGITQKRLREEAAYIEEQCQKQSDKKRGAYAKPAGDHKHPKGVKQKGDRKVGEKSHKPLKINKADPTADRTLDTPAEATIDGSGDDQRTHPTQQPNNPTIGDGVLDKSNPPPPNARERASVGVEFLEELASAAGYPTSSDPPDRWADDAAASHVAGWLDMGLTEAQILAAVRKSREHHHDPPHSLKALDGFIEAAAGKAMRKVRPAADPNKVAEFWESQIAKGARISPSAIKPNIARIILERGTVTSSRLRELGIAC